MKKPDSKRAIVCVNMQGLPGSWDKVMLLFIVARYFLWSHTTTATDSSSGTTPQGLGYTTQYSGALYLFQDSYKPIRSAQVQTIVITYVDMEKAQKKHTTCAV